jgi:hypothetical protein
MQAGTLAQPGRTAWSRCRCAEHLGRVTRGRCTPHSKQKISCKVRALQQRHANV